MFSRKGWIRYGAEKRKQAIEDVAHRVKSYLEEEEELLNHTYQVIKDSEEAVKETSELLNQEYKPMMPDKLDKLENHEDYGPKIRSFVEQLKGYDQAQENLFYSGLFEHPEEEIL